MRKQGDFISHELLIIYPSLIEQSMVDFNKGLFDLINNAYILIYPSEAIQLNSIYYQV